MNVSERAMRLLESIEQMTEEEIRQECMLCESEFVEQVDDLARAVRIFRAIKDGDARTLVKVSYGLL